LFANGAKIFPSTCFASSLSTPSKSCHGIASVGGLNNGVQSTLAASMLMNARTHSCTSIATLPIAPSKRSGLVVTSNGTSARSPAIVSDFGSIHAILDHTSPRTSPESVARVFQSICVAWFHAWAPAWLRIASPMVSPEFP
jgi:hypothetical protein